MSRMSGFLAFASALAASVGCPGEYVVNIEYVVPEQFSDDELADVEGSPTLTFETTVYTPDALSTVPKTCDGYAFGRDDIARLSGAGRVLTPENPEVPREGDKLVFVNGIDPERGVVLRGCRELGEIGEGVTTVTVDLIPLTDAKFIVAEYGADVANGQSAPILPEPEIVVRDIFGRPVATDVEVVVIGPDGEPREPVSATVEQGGRGGIAVEVDFAGPFRLEVVAAAPLLDARDRSSGMARPAVRTITPVVAGVRAPRQLIPVRYGPNDLAYVGTFIPLPTTLNEPSPDISVATGERDGNGAPLFEALDTSDIPGVGHELLAAIRDEQNEGELIIWKGGLNPELLFVPSTTSDLTPYRLDGDTTMVDHLGTLTPLSQLRFGRVVALGDCSTDIAAGPYLIALTGTDTAVADRRADTSFHILHERSIAATLPSTNVFLSTSFCLDADNGPPRRFLAGTDRDQNIIAVDLGAGIDPGALPAFDDLQYSVLESVLAAGVTSLGSPAVVLQTKAIGFQLRLQDLSLTVDANADTSQLVTTDRYILPGVPRISKGGPLLEAGRRTDVHLLGLGTGDEEGPQIPFLRVVAQDTDEVDPIVGGMRLTTCGRVDLCSILQADVDADGKQELYVGRSSGDRGDAIEYIEF